MIDRPTESFRSEPVEPIIKQTSDDSPGGAAIRMPFRDCVLLPTWVALARGAKQVGRT